MSQEIHNSKRRSEQTSKILSDVTLSDLRSGALPANDFVTVGPTGGRIISVLYDLRTKNGDTAARLPSEIYQAILSARGIHDAHGRRIEGGTKPNGFGYIAETCRKLVKLGVLEFRESRPISPEREAFRKQKPAVSFAISDKGKKLWEEGKIYIQERRAG